MKTKSYKANSWQMMTLEIAMEKLIESGRVNDAAGKELLWLLRDSVGITFRHEIKPILNPNNLPDSEHNQYEENE